MGLQENIACVQENILAAAQKAGRESTDITLVAVTKTVDYQTVQKAIKLGISHAGENRVQVLLDKYEHLQNSIDWHLIGHLQTNKVKYVIDKVSLIHSVDSIKLVEEIHHRAAARDIVKDILIQVNVAQEESKFGMNEDEVEIFLEKVSQFPNARVRGLMTIAPNSPNPEDNRKYFSKLHQLFVDIQSKKYDNIYMDYLSMGMSNDYMIAIEEGANIVRIGSALFKA